MIGLNIQNFINADCSIFMHNVVFFQIEKNTIFLDATFQAEEQCSVVLLKVVCFLQLCAETNNEGSFPLFKKKLHLHFFHWLVHNLRVTSVIYSMQVVKLQVTAQQTSIEPIKFP